mmetsp:Transcript_2420/g.3550  ORF Transcript_2420/g.3550 Transcript_2420/m.3550 type:complete len:207 (-) Transcript_2420:383-1003(-)
MTRLYIRWPTKSNVQTGVCSKLFVDKSNIVDTRSNVSTKTKGNSDTYFIWLADVQIPVLGSEPAGKVVVERECIQLLPTYGKALVLGYVHILTVQEFMALVHGKGTVTFKWIINGVELSMRALIFRHWPVLFSVDEEFALMVVTEHCQLVNESQIILNEVDLLKSHLKVVHHLFSFTRIYLLLFQTTKTSAKTTIITLFFTDLLRK